MAIARRRGVFDRPESIPYSSRDSPFPVASASIKQTIRSQMRKIWFYILIPRAVNVAAEESARVVNDVTYGALSAARVDRRIGSYD